MLNNKFLLKTVHVLERNKCSLSTLFFCEYINNKERKKKKERKREKERGGKKAKQINIILLCI